MSSSTTSSSDTVVSSRYRKCLTVTFKDVGIRVAAKGEDYGETVGSIVNPRRLLDKLYRNGNPQRHILSGVTGQVKHGEMVLVLGRPGSGCSSFLRVVANDTNQFQGIDGEVRYGSLNPKEARKYRDQITYNSEEDIHFPTVSVSDTLRFAAITKLPNERPKDLEDHEQYISHIEDLILSSLEISHTKKTLVGNEFVRGVSGGERKRVSIAEVMAAQSPIQCWDNSTRGLDASTALQFVKVLRRSCDEQGKTVFATFYQAGNAIIDQFDHVLVLCEGRQIFFGPPRAAKSYFEDMGFVYTPGANIADFLTSVAVTTERVVREDKLSKVPTRAEEFEAAYRASAFYNANIESIAATDEIALEQETARFIAAVRAEKPKRYLFGPSGVYTVSLWQQTIACTKRQFLIIWGDRWSNILKIASAVIMALVTGSLFYNLPPTSNSTFSRPGALFYPILLYCILSMSETTASFMGRPILSRHRQFGFYRPTAFSIACVLMDIPLTLVSISIFNIVFYFMVNFQHDAGKFFTNWIIIVAIVLCFVSFYRMIGSWCKRFGLASQISGWSTIVMMIYAGYLIPFTKMHVWFRWISYINPAFYAYGAVMGSEFGNLHMSCEPPQYIPYGSNYDNNNFKSCTVPGTLQGAAVTIGEDYIKAQYEFSERHVWRNFGIVIAFWVFFAIMTAVGLELSENESSGTRLRFKRGAASNSSDDAEKNSVVKYEPAGAGNKLQNLARGSLFTFSNLSYYVPFHGSEKQLLQDVSGYVKPGQLVALMGTSGAGKTTLMDVLAQRKVSGRIEGSIMVGGKPQGISFQRKTGYCEQNDVHEPTSTVREALLFSARLRQGPEIPDDEKVTYVDGIMDLLELTDIGDALVGVPGDGLSIEQRKRLTLGVELVAKPTLLFLDEPTSGLDGQSAYNIVRFLRKLAQAGQAIVCTIHQPSASLFDAFDVLLLLARGGRTTYFGETGERSSKLLDYFASRGAPCDPDANPAEHIINAVQGRDGKQIDWPGLWLESHERKAALEELDHLNSTCHDKEIADQEVDEDERSFAAPIFYQIKIVTIRQLVALWRNPDYVWNKLLLHIFASLFAGFTFWMIGTGSFDLQLRLFAILNFVFVAAGVINQLQPVFLHNRDIFETREKKSKTYHWVAFISGQIISEFPLLIICGTLYFACWYFTAGFPVKATYSGQVFLQMLLYEFLYTSVGQAIAALAPNEYFASLANPVILGAALINFCGVVVPYVQIQPFWRYWMYWLDPFTYLIGGLLVPVMWDVQVKCHESELTQISIPSGTTCGNYMADFLTEHSGYVVDATNTTGCLYCQYKNGAEYLQPMNILERYYGWRDVGITALFCISSWGLVFLMMKARSPKTMTAS